MSNIKPTNNLNIESELANLSLYKYHPNGILNVSLNRLQDMLDGKVEIVDPGNPFIYLLETSCMNTAFAIQEYTLLTRKLYPRLANTEEDLYLHMSDVDYLGRFSEPSKANVMFNILFNDFKSKATYDAVQKEYVLKLPRHLKLSVDKYIFTLPSALILRLTEDGVIDVKFENQDFNTIFPVETNYVNFDLFKINQEETYLTFELRLPEVDVESVEIPVEKSKLFKNTLTFNPARKFYFFRAFYFQDGQWKEMIVTHTDQVYDIYTPTCVIKVLQESQSVEYYIPPVYVNTNKIGTKVKFLIYTTNGAINVNFNDYKISDFSAEYNPIFPEVELDAYTQPLQLVTKVIYIKDEVVGGKNEMSFLDLKKSVIDNSIGDRKLPITNKQIEHNSAQNNFRLIKDVDVVTNRVFLLECPIPNAPTRYPITKFNLDILEYKTTVSDLRTNKNTIVQYSDTVTIIPEGTVFKLTDEGLVLLDQVEHTQLVSLSGIDLTTEVNDNTYVSTFYHYVLDTGNNTTQLRPYDLTNPVIKQVNFKEFNATARVGINTTSTNIAKTANGFTLDILSNVKKYVGTISEANVTPYIVYKDNNDSKFYLEGRLYTTINGNPVYRFEMDSQYYVDKDEKIHVGNFRDNNNTPAVIAIGLSTVLEVIYVSNVVPINYVATDMDSYLYNSYLAVDRAVVTLEEMTVKFGDHLQALYSQVHTSTGVNEYQKHEEDVPLRYKQVVYNSDNEVIHMPGDIVYGEQDNVIYEFVKGDLVYDENGQPIPVGEMEVDRYLNLLFLDYRAKLASKTILKDYRNYLRSYLTENIVENAKTVNDQLLENTEAYVVVPKNIGRVKVKTGGRERYISSMQKFRVNVYVNERIYNDTNARDSIVYTITDELDKYFYERVLLSKTELLNVLYEKVREFVNSVSLEGFTELNEEYMQVMNENARVGLNKVLVAEPDGYNLKDDISVSFILS